jgi:RNA polymerase sigma factor (sigma-70 family)
MNTTKTRPDKAEIDALVNANLGLAIQIASDYFSNPGYDRDDLKQEALYALWEAARYYRPERGEFHVYAGVCVRQRLKRHMGRRSQAPLIIGDPDAMAAIPAPPRNRGLMV